MPVFVHGQTFTAAAPQTDKPVWAEPFLPGAEMAVFGVLSAGVITDSEGVAVNTDMPGMSVRAMYYVLPKVAIGAEGAWLQNTQAKVLFVHHFQEEQFSLLAKWQIAPQERWVWYILAGVGVLRQHYHIALAGPQHQQQSVYIWGVGAERSLGGGWYVAFEYRLRRSMGGRRGGLVRWDKSRAESRAGLGIKF